MQGESNYSPNTNKVISREDDSTSQECMVIGQEAMDIRKKFSTVRTNKHWNVLFREVVECTLLEISRLGFTGPWIA